MLCYIPRSTPAIEAVATLLSIEVIAKLLSERRTVTAKFYSHAVKFVLSAPFVPPLAKEAPWPVLLR